MKRQTLNSGIIILIVLLGVVGTYLFFASQEESDVVVPPIAQSTPKENPTPDQSSAFIHVGTIPYSVQAGKAWIAELTTNTWAECLGDVYDPNGDVVLFDSTESAKAKLISPGSFRWIWDVPRDAQKGQWTIHLLCGNFENLATSEVSLLVE